MKTKHRTTLYTRIRGILEAARAGVARTVNTTQVVTNWLIGREIVEEEQQGRRRAGYGQRLIRDLSRRLQTEFGRGYSVDNLEWFRQLYIGYPRLLALEKSDAVRRISRSASIIDAARQLSASPACTGGLIRHTPSGASPVAMVLPEISAAVRRKSWQSGQLHPYVNYYDQERRTPGDNPTLGLILCTDKNDAVVRYTLGPDQQRKIFASRYKLHLPTEADLRAEIRRELRALALQPPRMSSP